MFLQVQHKICCIQCLVSILSHQIYGPQCFISTLLLPPKYKQSKIYITIKRRATYFIILVGKFCGGGLIPSNTFTDYTYYHHETKRNNYSLELQQNKMALPDFNLHLELKNWFGELSKEISDKKVIKVM